MKKFKYVFGYLLLLSSVIGSLTFAVELNSSNITGVPYNCTTEATSCTLSGKSITSIASNTFINHSNLDTLYLNNNQIISIESGDFSGLSNLNYLGLNNNPLINIANNIINLTTLVNGTGLNIGSNCINTGLLDSATISWINNKSSSYGNWQTQQTCNYVVSLPLSYKLASVVSYFTNKGYIYNNGIFSGSIAINFSATEGLVPVELKLKNNNSTLTIPQYVSLKNTSDNSAYTLGFLPPSTITAKNKPDAISAIRVGATDRSLTLSGGVATLQMPVPGNLSGDSIDIYYSEDDGATWNFHTGTTVSIIGGSPYVIFTTSHFTDFATSLAGGGSFSGSFVINNDATSTTSNIVTLNMTTTPEATHMRFSNDGFERSARETYATSTGWTLTGIYGTKTVYVQFDSNNDGSGDAQTSDSINYVEGGCSGGPGIACLNLEISAVDGYCQYGKNLDLGQSAQSYDAFVMSGDFLNLSGSDSRYCDDRAGKSAWTLDISASNLVTSGDNVFTIPNTAIEMFVATPQKYIGSSSFTFETGDFANQWANLTTVKTVFEKTSDSGSVGKLGTDSVDLRVNVPANQAIGAYQSTITIQVPVMTI